MPPSSAFPKAREAESSKLLFHKPFQSIGISRHWYFRLPVLTMGIIGQQYSSYEQVVTTAQKLDL